MSTSDTTKRTIGGAPMSVEGITSGGSTAEPSGLGCPRRRHSGRRAVPVGAWLGVGALTVGVGAVLAGGPAVAVASADTAHPGAASSSTGAPGAPAAGGPTARTTATARSAPAARTPEAAAAASVSRAIPGAGVTPGAGAAVSRAHLPASGALPATVTPAAAVTDIGASPRSLLTAGPVLVHPSLLTPFVKPSAALAPLTAAASTPAAATSPAAAVVTTTVVSPAASVSVSPLQKVLNAVTNALLSLGGLNTTTPTPAPGNAFQLALYSVARRLQDTFNPGGIPKAVGTITVGTPDPTTGALSFNPKIFTTTSGAPLTYQISVDPTLGKVTVNSDGVYTFTPTTAERLRVPAGGGTVKLNLIVYNGVQSINQVISAQVNPAILTLGPISIPVGNPDVAAQSPLGEALSPNGNILYVGGATAGAGGTVLPRLSLINTNTDLVSATIPVGSEPFNVAVSPDGTHVYLADLAGTVSTISTATNTVTAAIPVGGNPEYLAVGPAGTPAAGHLYVTNLTSNTVSVINTATNKVTATVNVGTNPAGVAVSPDGTHLYVGNLDGTVSVINTATNTVTATVPVSSTPASVAVSPDGTHVYVGGLYTGDSSNDGVSVINTATNTVTATIHLGTGHVPGGIAVSPDSSVVYVTDPTNGDVVAFDTATNAMITTFPANQAPFSVVASPDGTQLYVTNIGLNTVSVISV